MEKTKEEYGNYVCINCGIPFLTDKQKEESGVATFNRGYCCICRKFKSVTHIRHYNYLRPI